MKDFEIRCDESRLEKNHTLYGKFTLGPFLPGQGTTFGNALRRSLLSELSGLAITAFEIVGVMQEFSTLPGLRESVLDLSLNLKQVVLTGILPYSTPPVGFLKVRGPAIIYAADLQLPAGVYCASPEHYIATLASNGVLNLKFLVSAGKGYSTQPYSLYLSLSKIKLQPTLSNRFISHTDYQHVDNRLIDTGLGVTNSTHKLHDTPLFDDQWRSSLESVTEIQKISKIGIDNFSSAMHSSLESKDKKTTSQGYKPLNSEFFNSSDQLRKVKNNDPKGVRDLRELSTSYENKVDSTNSSSNPLTPAGLGVQGYVSIQKQTFQRVNPHQVLPIDPVFTPVSQVNFLTRANDRFETPGENVVLEIWTNGSIHPKRALEEAALSLVQNFDTLLKSIQQASSFNKGLRYWNSLQSFNEKKDGSENSQLSLHRAVYNLDIGNLDLSLETFIILKKAKIKTLGHLLTTFYSKEKAAFLNKRAIEELSKVVNKLGINLSL